MAATSAPFPNIRADVLGLVHAGNTIQLLAKTQNSAWYYAVLLRARRVRTRKHIEVEQLSGQNWPSVCRALRACLDRAPPDALVRARSTPAARRKP